MVFSQKNRYPNGIKAVIVVDDQLLIDPADTRHYELQRFNMCWKTALGFECVLVYTTEKTIQEFMVWSKENPIQRPDILITASGTEIYVMDKGEKLYQPWRAKILEGFDKPTSKLTVVTEFPWQLKLKPPSEQRTHVLKYTLHETIQPNSGGFKGFSGMLTRRLLKRQCKAQVFHNGGLDVSILPECAGVGSAIVFLLTELEKSYSRPSACTIVATECSSGGSKLFAMPLTFPALVQEAPTSHREYFESLGSDITKYQSYFPLSAGLIETLQEFDLLPKLENCDGACRHHHISQQQGKADATESSSSSSFMCSFPKTDFFSSLASSSNSTAVEAPTAKGKGATPTKEAAPAKEATPDKEATSGAEAAPATEASAEKESVDKEPANAEEAASGKDATPSKVEKDSAAETKEEEENSCVIA
uniref:Sucrose phosphatase-like domain-containing protein n=1 Tax=Pyramimonas obovata TaxID=1411642 RepID=A0A7S0ND99_9CHLO|mmetsp:Transcript_23675/g.51682  ORF Transcript_23675/g.51682 Transcript_23675/m.51682 type:complete len:419 (+) Transcript_23675:142-1398(+)